MRVWGVFLFLVLLVFNLSQALAQPSSPKVLVLYQESKEPPYQGILNLPPNAILLINLLGHFNAEIARMPISKYNKGLLADYEYAFYEADDAGEVSPDFLADLVEYPQVTVIWLRRNIQQLLDRYSETFGFKVLPARGGYEWVTYNGQVYDRPDAESVVPVQVSNFDLVRMHGMLQSRSGFIPFAIHSRNLWFFPDASYFGISYLIFSDLLHDVFKQPHTIHRRFVIRIEDIHPLRNVRKLRQLCKTMARQNVPFILGVVPQYQPAGKEVITLESKPHLVEALKQCLKQGGSVVMNGYLSQWRSPSGGSYEFWDVEKDQPVSELKEETIREKMIRGIQELTKLELYPVGWETPSYAASEEAYDVISGYFSTAVESRQVSNRSHRLTQSFPFIVRDIHGQTVIPENLGFINYEIGETVDKKIKAAKTYWIVRDAVVGVFYHPYFDAKYLDLLLEGFKKMGLEALDMRTLPNAVVAENLGIFTGLHHNPYPIFKASRRWMESEKNPRLLKIPVDQAFLHVAQMNHQYQRVTEDWFRKPRKGGIIYELPSQPRRIFFAETTESEPPWTRKITVFFTKLLIGATDSPLATVQRWVVWVLFIFTLFVFISVIKILVERTSYHESHFRKKRED